MLTTGIVKQRLIVDGKAIYKVRLPLFETAGQKQEFIAPCNVCYAPGNINFYQEGDRVYVDFLCDSYSSPVIVGKIYRGEEENATNSSYDSTLEVTKTAILPNDTTIGDISLDDIKAMKAQIEQYSDKFDIVLDSIEDATSTKSGVVKLGSDIVQTEDTQPTSSTEDRTYAVQVNDLGQMVVNVPWVNSGGGTDDTWRNIKVNGTELLGISTNTGALNLQQGDNINLIGVNGSVLISATDTTYNSLPASQSGTAVSLVTTGEKYTWNHKSDFSGNYNDLTNKPTIPTKTSDLTNDSGYITDSYHDSTKEDVSNKVTSISSSSTDTQYPSAKCVYDNIEDVREIATGKKQTYVVDIAHNSSFNSQADKIEVGSITTIDNETVLEPDLQIGDNVYVVELDVPDRWVCEKKSSSVIQLCNKTSPTGTNKWYSSTGAGDGLWTRTNDTINNLITFTKKATTTSGNFQLGNFGVGVTTESTHVYLTRWYVENNLGTTGWLSGLSGSVSNSFASGYKGYAYLIATNETLSGGYFYFFCNNSEIAQDATIIIGKPQVFDLTLMYGAGSEPNTYEEFVADYPNDFYPYNTNPGSQVAVLSILETVKPNIASISVNGTPIQPVNENINIIVPTDTSDLTNGAGFITSSDLPTNYVTTDTNQTITGTKTFDAVPIVATTNLGTRKNLFATVYSTMMPSTGGSGSGYAYYKLPDDGKTYTLSVSMRDVTKDFGNGNVFGYTGNGGDANNGYAWMVQGNTISSYAHTFYPSDAMRCISIYRKGETYFNDLIARYNIQLEIGDTATPYEPWIDPSTPVVYAEVASKNDIPTISVNGTQVQPVNNNVNIDTNIYPVGNTNYRIQFKVVNGQPQLEYEEII